jgi:hypothetical protein
LNDPLETVEIILLANHLLRIVDARGNHHPVLPGRFDLETAAHLVWNWVMTPAANTLYSEALFLALACLLRWKARQRRL